MELGLKTPAMADAPTSQPSSKTENGGKGVGMDLKPQIVYLGDEHPYPYHSISINLGETSTVHIHKFQRFWGERFGY